MEILKEIGFVLAGEWTLEDDKIDFKLTNHGIATDILYAFESGNVLYYIGKTTKTLESRMKQYRKPGPTQSTNIRINGRIHDLLAHTNEVNIHVLINDKKCKHGEYIISLAAGLEDILIEELKPKLNFHGNKKIATGEQESEPNTISEIELIAPHKNAFVEVKITETYLGKFFNVKKQYEDLFGPHDTSIRIQFGEDDNEFVIGRIDRTSNSAKTPRIYGGATYSIWVKNNFKVSQIMKIDVYSPVSIKLYK